MSISTGARAIILLPGPERIQFPSAVAAYAAFSINNVWE
jgi:hypothetical protein